MIIICRDYLRSNQWAWAPGLIQPTTIFIDHQWLARSLHRALALCCNRTNKWDFTRNRRRTHRPALPILHMDTIDNKTGILHVGRHREGTTRLQYSLPRYINWSEYVCLSVASFETFGSGSFGGPLGVRWVLVVKSQNGKISKW